jgi:hypothetical protein
MTLTRLAAPAGASNVPTSNAPSSLLNKEHFLDFPLFH